MQSQLPHEAIVLADLPDFLTAKDICRLLRISRTALSNASRLTDFPAPLRISKRALRWRKADLEAYLNRQEGKNG